MAELITCKRILSAMVLFGFIIHFMLRVNISIAIVKMVELSNSTLQNDSSHFDWNQEEKNNILGSFFLGYILTEVPGGRLAEMFGTRIVMGTGLLSASIFTLLTPAASFLHYYWLLAARFLLGLSLGVQWPATFPITTKWIAPERTSNFLSHMIASSLGAAIALPICGFLIVNFGWPSVFYFTGTISLTWTLCWFYFIYDSPKQHPRMSQAERDVLTKITAGDVCIKKLKTPWMKIWTSGPVWATVVGNIGQSLPFFIVLSHLPTYMNDVLGFNIKQNGMFSSLPYLAKYTTAVVSSYAADKVMESKKYSTIAIRKSFSFAMYFGAFLLMIAQATWGYNYVVSITVFIVFLALNGLAPTALFANAVDITPSYSGTVFGIDQIFVGLSGYAATQLVTLFTKDEQNFQQWSYVFWVLAALNLFTLIFFFIFASGDIQEWDPKCKKNAEQIQLKEDNI